MVAPIKKIEKPEDWKVDEGYVFAGGHYPKHVYKGRNSYVTVCGTITGCGLAQMYGVAYLASDPDAHKIINEVRKDFIEGYGAGGILCTLGASWRHFCEAALLELGFEKLTDYPNYHHDRSGREKQSLYILR